MIERPTPKPEIISGSNEPRPKFSLERLATPQEAAEMDVFKKTQELDKPKPPQR